MRNSWMLRVCGAVLLAGVMSCSGTVVPEEAPQVGVKQDALASDVTVQVLDLRPGDLGSNPTALAVADGSLFFAASDDTTGLELWKSDGTEAGTVLVKDILAGTSGSNPRGFTGVNGTVFFAANGLWKTDGTAAGTVQVTYVLPRVEAQSSPVGMNGVLYFSGYDSNGFGEEELWRSDGTAAGTFMVRNIATSSFAQARWLTVVGNTLYFTIDDGSTGEELWKSDGTSAGTVRVRDINPGVNGAKPRNLVNVNGALFFTADDGANGEELWKSDGTAAGTVMVKDLHLGPSIGSQPEFLTNVGGTLFFVLDQSINGIELWKSDGTAAGTVKVADISAMVRPPFFTAMGGALYFAMHATGGYELWKSDGTEAGTGPVRAFLGGSQFPVLAHLTVASDALHFVFNGPNGSELWKSDGTAAGTVLVTTFLPVPSSEVPASLLELGGTLYFTANDGLSGRELWTSDGTAQGTVLVRNIQTHGASSAPKSLTNVAGTLFLVSNDGLNLDQLWKSDGTEAGTGRVKLLTQGFPDHLAELGGALYFSASESGFSKELWKSDGTEAGTVRVKDIQPGGGGSYPRVLRNAGGTLYFAADDGSSGEELWKSDGTAAGTVRVKDILAGSASSYPSPTTLTLPDGTMFFSADNAVVGTELWKSDGTEAGTVLVKDIRPGASGSVPNLLAQWNGAVYFMANDGTTGSELWKSDGTAAGTVLLKDLWPGTSSGIPGAPMVALGNLLFFAADDGSSGRELWRTDGTAAGTVRLKDIRGGSGPSSPLSLTLWNGALYFTADDGVAGRELWKSDGTEVGTVRVKDIRPGLSASGPTSLVVFNGALYFTADDGVNGREVWKSDGTEAGTVRVTDLLPGAASALPEQLVVSGGRLYFLADDFTHGKELWVLASEVPDTTPPQVTCPEPVVAEAASASGATVSYPAAVATDDVTASPSLSYSHPSGGLFPLGETVVTVTAVDEAGNSETCQFQVTVRDATAPTLTCPVDVTQEATSASGAQVSYPAATVSDAVSSSVDLTYSQASGTAFVMGETQVTVTATDDAGNSASCQFTVTVRDSTPPAFSCPADLTAEALGPDGAPVDFVLPTATDVVSASPEVTASPAPGSTFALGSTVVTLSSTDEAGNTGTCQFKVTVRDTTAPTILCPSDFFVEATSAAGAAVDLPSAQGSDTVSAVVLSYSPASGETFKLGDTLVTATATDASGNAASCQFTVTVRDTTAPLLTCPVDVGAEATSASGAQVQYPAASASDAVSSVVLTYSQESGTAFAFGETQVTVTAKDAVGNTALCQFTVTVQDTTAPAFTCPADRTAEALGSDGAPVDFMLPTATDAVSGSVAVTASHVPGDTFPVGSTAVTLTSTDDAGNVASCQFQVVVRDTTAPTILCPESLAAEATSAAGAVVDLPSAQGSDTVSAVVLRSSPASGTTFSLGDTLVTATATDASGNSASCQFTVTVRDTTAPTLACPADVTVQATGSTGAVVDYPVASASDAVSPATLAYSLASGSHFPLGSTSVTVTATDGAGNAASCQFTVTVRSTSAPRLTCPADVVAEATSATGAGVDYPAATVSEGASQTRVEYSHPSGAMFPLGSTVVTATATDAEGRTASCQFQVTVRDTTPPDVGCPADVVTEAESATGAFVLFSLVPPRDAVTRSPGIAFSHATGSRFSLGTTEVTVTATDDAGNAASCRFQVTVRDTTVPQVTCPANVSERTGNPAGMAVSYAPASASDGASAVTLGYSHPSGSHFEPGITPVVVTATDAAGNAARCEFQVTVSVQRDVETGPGCACGPGTAEPMSFGWAALLLLAWRVALRRPRVTG